MKERISIRLVEDDDVDDEKVCFFYTLLQDINKKNKITRGGRRL